MFGITEEQSRTVFRGLCCSETLEICAQGGAITRATCGAELVVRVSNKYLVSAYCLDSLYAVTLAACTAGRRESLLILVKTIATARAPLAWSTRRGKVRRALLLLQMAQATASQIGQFFCLTLDFVCFPISPCNIWYMEQISKYWRWILDSNSHLQLTSPTHMDPASRSLHLCGILVPDRPFRGSSHGAS